ncbi:MAG: hypothetical protein A4E28_02209 [Methanocella sp. PtaU1.Bin125]|nr:MAG: hypothetical protein A4E28_02209 [Methanocella sp. PtaU1.Bin125]
MSVTLVSGSSVRMSVTVIDHLVSGSIEEGAVRRLIGASPLNGLLARFSRSGPERSSSTMARSDGRIEVSASSLKKHGCCRL